LQERLTSLRDKVSQSEQALQKYREERGIVSLGGSAQAPAGQQVNQTTEKLVAARARRAELEGSYLQLRNNSSGDYSSSPLVMRDPAVMESMRQLNEVNRRLAELSETLGPRNNKILELESQKEQIQADLARQRAAVVRSVTREYEAARSTEQALERELRTARTGVQDVNREEFQLAALEREAQTNRQLFDMFMSRAKETNLASDVQASVARVVDEAVPSNIPFKPARSQIVLVSAVLALFLGAMASLLIDRLDNTVKGGEDAEVRLKLPLLSALPAVPEADRKQMACLLLENPHSHFAESIRTARTGVMLSNIDQEHKIVLITSTLPNEGKTTVAINLALAHAQTKRTLLIDADMRRSQVGRSLRMAPGSHGLSNLVAGTSQLAACVQKFKGSDLYVMPVGDMPPNPLELLLSQRFRNALAGLSKHFEMVIIDSPPVELVSEALVLAPLATSTVFVVKAMSTPAPLARKSIQRLQRAGGNMLGVIVNQLDFKHAQRYYGEYGASGYTYGGYGATAQVGANSRSAPVKEREGLTA
jgi:polysaccharide biosynthesis transport protein